MDHPLLGSNFRFDGESGEFVSADHMRVATVIHDYNPELSLIWIPKAQRGPDDLPYAILHSPLGKEEYIVRFITESEMNDGEDILRWVFLNDMTKNDPYAAVIASETAHELLRMNREIEEREERADVMKHVLSSKKNWYKHNGVTYRG